MFDNTRIHELFGLVGFMEDHRFTTYDLVDSSSGLFFDSEIPYVTLKMINAVYDSLNEPAAPTWSGATTYSYGDFVLSSGNHFLYINETATSGNATSDTTYWKPYSKFANFVRKRTLGYLSSVVTDWSTHKGIRNTAHTLIMNSQIMARDGNLYDEATVKVGGTGIALKIRDSLGLRIKIDKLFLHFASDASIPIKIYESGKKDPVYNTPISYTGDGSIQEHDLEFTFLPGRIYWIGYDDTGLPNAVNQIENAASIYQTDYVDFHFFNVDDFSVTPNPDNVAIEGQNRGVNISLSAYCDYTDLIIDQKLHFAKMFAKGVSVKWLEYIAYNPEVIINKATYNVDKREIKYLLDGDTQGKFRNGLKWEYDKIIKDLSLDKTNIDKICLPCRKRSARIRSAV